MINISNVSIVNQVLALSETGCLDDLTIVCSDGTVSSNSFVLTAMFPVLRNVLETPLQYEERPVILVPDLATCDLETFLQNVFQHTAVFGVSKDLELLFPRVPKDILGSQEPDQASMDSQNSHYSWYELFQIFHIFSNLNQFQIILKSILRFVVSPSGTPAER